jgi:hypothetical protein
VLIKQKERPAMVINKTTSYVTSDGRLWDNPKNAVLRQREILARQASHDRRIGPLWQSTNEVDLEYVATWLAQNCEQLQKVIAEMLEITAPEE